MTTLPSPKLQSCWNQIGIAGDRSCPELPTYTHCRNCPVYSLEGRRLLERNVPADYGQEWAALMAAPTQTLLSSSRKEVGQAIAAVFFRVQGEWLALPASLFKEVTSASTIHTIPHRSNQILLGLVNIRGELQMCVSLAHLLTLEAASPSSKRTITPPRMMVLEREGDRWVFPVDEIYGVQRLRLDELKPAPTNVAKSTNTYTKGLISWRNTHVSFLDDELLFYTLSRRAL